MSNRRLLGMQYVHGREAWREGIGDEVGGMRQTCLGLITYVVFKPRPEKSDIVFGVINAKSPLG